jgi:hypothetical protein
MTLLLQVGKTGAAGPKRDSPSITIADPRAGKSLFETELAGIGGFQLTVKSIGRNSFCNLGLLHECSRRIVIMRSAQVFMSGTELSSRVIEQGAAGPARFRMDFRLWYEHVWS